VPHLVGQRRQVGRFEELHNVVAFTLVEAHLAVDDTPSISPLVHSRVFIFELAKILFCGYI